MKPTRAVNAGTAKPNGRANSIERSSTTPRAAGADRSPYRADKRAVNGNIVETAAMTGPFKTLGAAIRAAHLVDTLSGTGPFTVFAPTDKAFSKVPKADLDALFRDEVKLTQMISNHVVSNIVKAPREGSPRSATTVNGAELRITAKDQGFTVNDARVVKTQIHASNGVIHAIDTVLISR